jgi:putative AbiEi antitoxin of type IV toxin-antitoxin system/uncharacterized protein DUF559
VVAKPVASADCNPAPRTAAPAPRTAAPAPRTAVRRRTPQSPAPRTAVRRRTPSTRLHGFVGDKPGKPGLKIAETHEVRCGNHEVSVPAVILGSVSVINLPDRWRLAGIRTTGELLREGKSATQITTLVRRGTLIQVRRGVYARADLAAELATHPGGDHLLKTAAALATLGPAAASHESAAIIHGMDLLKQPRVVTLTRPQGANRSPQSGARLHYAWLPADHITVVHGMRVTTAARTVIDLARSLEFRAGIVTADSALRDKLVTKSELESLLAKSPRRAGRRRAADVIAFADDRAESVLESIARVVFRDCGLPPPELQVWVGGAEVVGRVDFLWRKYRTVVEVDGMLKYSDPARAVRQLERDRRLREAGYEVVHLTWQDITQNPPYVASAIRSAFARAARPLPVPSSR